MSGGRHPVGGKNGARQIADISRSHIGERLAYRHARRGRRIQNGERRFLADAHYLAAKSGIVGQRYRGICDRNLPRPDHLIAAYQPANRAVANTHQKCFVGNCGKPENTVKRLFNIDTGAIKRRLG